MLESEVQIVIDKPVEQVFVYLADLQRHPEWSAHKLTLRPTSPGQIGPNTTFDSIGVQLLIPWKDRVKVSECVPNASFAYDASGDFGDYRHYFRLQREGEGTRLRYGATLLGGPLYKRLLARSLWVLVPLTLRGDLRRIKARLEALDRIAQPANE